jgi:hypothetical protein
MGKRLKVVWVIAALALGVGAAEAGPITGSFSIVGNFLPVISATGDVTSLGLATGLDFIELVGDTTTPGTDGEFLVTSANGNFSSLAGQTGTIRDFTFTGAGTTDYPSMPPLLSAFQSVGGMTFDLLNVTVVMQDADFLNLSGSGIFHLAGFDATAGTFRFSGNEADGTFSFSASEKSTGTTVPEPGSLVLFAVGGLFVGARRRFSGV